MTDRRPRSIRASHLISLAAGGLLTAGAVYAGYVLFAWLRYGRQRPVRSDSLLDQLMPIYDIREQQQIDVAAPASTTLAVAAAMDLNQSAISRLIFRTRELLLSGQVTAAPASQGLVADVLAMGWVALAEVSGREIVFGAVTQPWQAHVVFRSIPAGQFTAFAEPEYVKIVWTLRADSRGPNASTFRTETRAVATDEAARRKFRWYWAFLSPGIYLIRYLSLHPLRRAAERRSRAAIASPSCASAGAAAAKS